MVILMNIKISPHIKGYVGPSQKYYDTKNRFDSILKDKLGVESKEEIKDNKYDESLIFDFGEEEVSNAQDSESPIFFGDEFSQVSTPSNSEKLYSQRNFNSVNELNQELDEILSGGVVNPDNLRALSNNSAEFFNSKLEGSPLAGLGEHFKRAEEQYNVNGVLLMAIAKLESNFGRSKIARDKNNLFGFQAYDSSPYASAKFYKTKQDSIYDAARLLSKNYLSPKGPYFNGYSIDSIGIKYSSDPKWASKVRRIASEFMRF